MSENNYDHVNIDLSNIDPETGGPVITEGSPPSERQEEKMNLKMYELSVNSYIRNRIANYPPIEDYVDGIVKGDQEQIDKYIADCLKVKEDYPKPEDD